jgi:hypothetical protein
MVKPSGRPPTYSAEQRVWARHLYYYHDGGLKAREAAAVLSFKWPDTAFTATTVQSIARLCEVEANEAQKAEITDAVKTVLGGGK